MNSDADLVLASASPRRRELLERMGLRLAVAPADVDETPLPGERAGDYVRRVAGAKCDAACAAAPSSPLAVLAADTTVVVDGRILGKPADAAEARDMLALLGGRRHEVVTAYRIRRGDRVVERAVTTVVVFRGLQPAEVDAYVASGEWEGKAGGYAVQGIAGAFVMELRGSHTNVIGLPLAEVLADLLALGALPAYPPPGFGERAVTRAEEVAAGLARVRDRLAAAVRAAGRAPASVRLVAVSKKMTADDVRAAHAAGQVDFGENYAQELRDKRDALADAPGLAWHFIGPLQSNKVKYVAGKVALIHSVDSMALADEIERRAAPQPCLVQVNVAGEAQKRGLPPEALPALLDHFAGLSFARCLGLTVIPPFADDPQASRPHFAALRALRDREAARPRPNVDLSELSMGMSQDLEVAVSEGATLVRVGTAIFGARS